MHITCHLIILYILVLFLYLYLIKIIMHDYHYFKVILDFIFKNSNDKRLNK